MGAPHHQTAVYDARVMCQDTASAHGGDAYTHPSRMRQASFKREVSETVLRCAQQGFDPSFVVVELNGLKIAEDRTFADCASAILTTLLGLCFPAAPKTKPEYQGLYPAAAADSGTPVSCCAAWELQWGLLGLALLGQHAERCPPVLGGLVSKLVMGTWAPQ